MTELHFPENYKALYPKDFSWKANPDKADETLIFYVVTEDSCICTIQFQYASSFVKSTAGITAKFWNKDVHQTAMKTGKVSEITYSDDKRSISFFDSSVTAQSPDSLDFKIKVGFEPKKIQYDLDFTSTGPFGCQMDGEPPECMRTKDSKMLQDLVATGKVTGTATVNGTTINIKGSGLLCHNYSSNVKNSLQSMKGRNFIYINDGKDGLFINETVGKDFSIGVGNLVLDNKLVGVATDCKAEPISTKVEPTSKYNIPTEIKYSMKGTMIEDGKPFTASVVLKPENLTEVHDFLGSLPFAIRFIIKAFAKPFSFQWLDPGEVEVIIGEDEKETKTIKSQLLQETMCLHK